MIIHTVTKSETVYSIAKMYGTTIRRLQNDNGLLSDQQLVVGQSLLILQPKTIYTVQQGDTIDNIAIRHATNIRTILRNNPTLSVTQSIYPGQTIVIDYEGDKRAKILTNGYAYPNISEDSIEIVLPYLSMITPFTYGIRSDGSLISPDDAVIRKMASEIKTSTVMHVSTLGEDDLFNSELPGIIFSNPVSRRNLINNIVNQAVESGYKYIDIDFEFIPASNAYAYADFIKDLRYEANKKEISVIVALAPKSSDEQPGLLYEGHLYRELGESADLVLLMTYEWGYTFGPPQPVAPIDKVREVVDYAITQIPTEKILLGIPNYGYDWNLPYETGVSRAKTISNVDAVRLADKYKQDIQYDSTAQTPYFYYNDSDDSRHVVWFEDARSILSKLNLISEFNLSGFSVWNVMNWFPALWLTANTIFEIKE